jgi:membrane protein YqaA with SNARE-associated domain
VNTLLTLAGLFGVAFAAASLLPGQSEALLVGLLVAGKVQPLLLVAVASAGNTLGATLNWWLGMRIERYRDRRWFPASPAALERARVQYHRYGRWSLLLSWMPLIGDPLTLAAGLMREPLGSFLALVAVAKTVRYVALAIVVLWIG